MSPLHQHFRRDLTFLVLSYAPPGLDPLTFVTCGTTSTEQASSSLPGFFELRITNTDDLSNSPAWAQRSVSSLMKNLSRPLKALLLARTIASGVAADDHIPHVVGEHGHRHIWR